MTPLLAIGVAAAVASSVFTPVARRVGQRWRTGAMPRDRQPGAPVPRIGGVVVIGVWAATVLAAAVAGSAETQAALRTLPLPAILTAVVLVAGIGVVDDIRPLRASAKITIEVLAAIIIVASGVVISTVTVFGQTHTLAAAAIPITVVWVVVITNAFNLLDGLDGLAGGLALVTGATCTAIVVWRGDLATALLLVPLLGALAGFLPYNVTPASIYLGDGGSLGVGIILATSAVTGFQKESTAIASAVPLLIFALPLADVVMAVFRRVRNPADARSGRFVDLCRRLVEPDLRHIHHRVVALGLSPRAAVFLLYGIALTCALAALATVER